MSLNHEIILDELTEESVPIEKPIANTDIYILVQKDVFKRLSVYIPESEINI